MDKQQSTKDSTYKEVLAVLDHYKDEQINLGSKHARELLATGVTDKINHKLHSVDLFNDMIDELMYMIGDAPEQPSEDDLLNVLIGYKTLIKFHSYDNKQEECNAKLCVCDRKYE